MTDNVTQPSHYKSNIDRTTHLVRLALLDDMPPPFKSTNLECFEAMVSMLTIDEVRGYLRGNSFKYRWRYNTKNGIEDLKKAQWYEDKLLILEETLEHCALMDVNEMAQQMKEAA